jgi:hypothetical protein
MIVLLKMPLHLLRFVLKSIVVRCCRQGFQARLHCSTALLEHMSQFMRQQFLSRDGVRLIASLAEINIAACGEGMGLNAARRLGRCSVAVDSHIVKTLAEALLHHGPRMRRKRRSGAAPAHGAVKIMCGCRRVSLTLALHRFLLALFAAPSRAGASATGHIGPTHDRCGCRVPGQRSAGGALDSHIARAAQKIRERGSWCAMRRLHGRQAGGLRLKFACLQRR